jgi:hypothetical protein
MFSYTYVCCSFSINVFAALLICLQEAGQKEELQTAWLLTQHFKATDRKSLMA